jgi:ADP-heptose:LPS heptosyltransferase
LPAAKVYLKPLERLAIFDADPVPRHSIGPQPTYSHQLALLPGSGSELKNWPEEKWAELLDYLLRSTDYQFLLIGGEAEGERLQRLSRAFDPSRLRVAQSLPLVDLAILMQSSASFIGHDSGISHLAAALGLPGILLWGHTTEEIWRPPSARVRILKHQHSLEKLPVEKVIKALRALEKDAH